MKEQTKFIDNLTGGLVLTAVFGSLMLGAQTEKQEEEARC